VSWELQQHYLHNNNDSTACSSAGGVIQQPSPLAGQPSDCQVLLRQAGPEGTGTITFTPAPPTQSTLFDSPTSSSLPVAAKIGIGVTISAVSIFIATLVALYYRAKRKKHSPSQLEPSSADTYQKQELPDNSVTPPEGHKILLDSAEIKELEGATARLDQEQLHELGGNPMNETDGNQIEELGGNEIEELDGNPIEKLDRNKIS
jgi:hypothetical protein